MPGSRRPFALGATYVEIIHDSFISVWWPNIEPVGPEEYRDRGLVQSAVARPFQAAFGKELFRTIPEKAAALFHSLIANHPFDNTLVPIRRLAAISPLKTLGIARLRPWTRLCASVWSEVSASHGLCHAAVRIAGLHPSWNQDYILWPIFLLSNYCYHVISSCCASSCTPARAGGP